MKSDDRQQVLSVEFLDDSDGADHGVQREIGSKWRYSERLLSQSWMAITTSVVLLIGAALAAVGVFLPQLTFRLVPGRGPSDSMNGFGSFHLVGRASPSFSLDGHAPALGAVALVAAAVVLVARVVLLWRSTDLASAVATGVACVASGVVAGAFACDAVQGSGFPRREWDVGFWLLAVGAAACVVASLISVIRRCIPERRAAHTPSDLEALVST